jgi:hypothetical protein
MKKLICIFFMTMPVAVMAQKNLFMDELNRVNSGFFMQANVSLVQTYFYYADSAMTQLVDSSIIVVTKNNSAIDYKANGLESFSDSGYSVKINDAGGYMIVSKTAKTDSAHLKALFSQGFSGFGSFNKKVTPGGFNEWELSAGTAGINSATLLLDLKSRQIKSVKMFMAGNHPLVSPFKKAGQTTAPTVIIRVDFRYLPAAESHNAGKLSDFIKIDSAEISPAAKYKGYSIKLIPGKR